VPDTCIVNSPVSYRAMDCGMTDDHSQQSTVRGLVSQPITAYVSHISCQLLVATLVVASTDHVVGPISLVL